MAGVCLGRRYLWRRGLAGEENCAAVEGCGPKTVLVRFPNCSWVGSEDEFCSSEVCDQVVGNKNNRCFDGDIRAACLSMEQRPEWLVLEDC